MHLAGTTEIAKSLGVTRQAVVNWRSRNPEFPEPLARLASGPVYDELTIMQWLSEQKLRKHIAVRVQARIDELERDA